MTHRLDPRSHGDFNDLLSRMPKFRVVPLVGSADLRELRVLMPYLEKLEYPINSAGELIEQIGGSDASFDVYDVKVEPMRMIKYMPAYYFPVASLENLVEKMAELVRANRKAVDLPTELAELRRQLPPMRFPIEDRNQLLKQIGTERSFRFQGVPYRPSEVIDRVPESAFPLQSAEDFELKVGELMLHRPLIAGHDGRAEWE